MLSTTLLMDLLAIPSPTYGEQQKTDFIESWIANALPMAMIDRIGNNLMVDISAKKADVPVLVFVGHTDTVPDFFTPYKTDDRMYGAGASDMQSGLACLLAFVANHHNTLIEHYQVKLIVYDKEENTPLHQNGLNECIQQRPTFFDGIDVAIVGEPTDNAIQLGCVGSIHATVTVQGRAAHSARPWHGENALYNALPLIQSISDGAKGG